MADVKNILFLFWLFDNVGTSTRDKVLDFIYKTSTNVKLIPIPTWQLVFSNMSNSNTSSK